MEPSDLPLLVAQGTVPLEGARDIVYRILLISNEVSGSFEGPEHRPDLIVEVRTLDGLGNPTWIKATNDYLPAVVAHALAGHASERAVFWKLECGLRNAAT